MSSEVDKLEHALQAYWRWRDDAERGNPDELLREHGAVRDYLEPLLHEADAEEAAPIGRIGDFTLHREIGRGGMGVVYEATQEPLGRRAALKVLPIGPWTTESRQQRFQREAQLAARLEHPGIARVLCAGTTEDRRYYAMDLVDGVSLDRVLTRLAHGVASGRQGTELGVAVHEAMDHRLEARALHPFWLRPFVPVVCDIVRQVALALHHAHECGVLHRDVKPSNIVLQRDGRAVLVDFGLARAFDAPWLTVEPAGTPHYMSPEVVRHDVQYIDARSDVYSLGASFYQALCGQPPFPGERSVQVMRQIEQAEVGSPRRQDPGLTKDLAAVCLRALDRSPRHRYQSARAFADDLTRLLENRPVAARPPSIGRRFAGLVRRHPASALAVTLLLLAAAVFSAVTVTLLDSERAAWQRAQAADYRAKVRAASSALGRGHPSAAAQMLASTPETLRGWEWHHLSTRLDAAVVRAHSDVGLRGHLCASGRTSPLLWSAADDGSVRAFCPVEGTQKRLVELPDGLLARTVSRRTSDGILSCIADDGHVFDLDARTGAVRSRRRIPGAEEVQPIAGGACIVATTRELVRVERDGAQVTLQALPPHTSCVHELFVTDDGSFVAARIEDPRPRKPDPVVCWHRAGNHRLVHPEGFVGGAVLATRGELVLVSRYGSMVVFGFTSPAPVRTVDESRTGVVDVAAHAGGIAVLGEDAVVRLHSADSLERAECLPHLSPGQRVACAEDGSWIAAVHTDAQTMSVYRGETGQRVLSGFDGFVHHVIWSPDDSRLAAATVYGEPSRLRVFDTAGWAELATVPGAKPQRFSDDGRRLLCEQGSILAVATGELERAMEGGRSPRLGFESLRAFCRASAWGGEQLDHYTAVSPDLTMLARIRWFGGPTVEILRLADGHRVRELGEPGREFRGVEFSPNGSTIATGDRSGEVLFWDARTFERRPRSLPHPDIVYDIAWSPDGSRIVTACKDSVVRVFDAHSLEQLLELTGHAAYVRAVAWSHDGKRLASASADGTVRIWSATDR